MTIHRFNRGGALAALAIAYALAMFQAQPAAAQTAKKLKCNGCVKSKQLKNNGITSKDIRDGQVNSADLANNAVNGSKIAAGAVGFGELSSSMQQRITDLETAAPAPVTAFAVGLDIDLEEATLGTNGPLEILLRCRVNDAGNDRIQLVATSTQTGWFRTGDTAGRAANTEVVLLTLSVAAGNTSVAGIGGVSIIAADGSSLALPFTTRGFNAFGHVCNVSGTAVAVGPIP